MKRPEPLRNKAFLLLTGGLFLLLGLAWLYTRIFTQYRHLFPPCLFYELTHLHCPGCGATRAAHALLQLDIVRAIRMNALFVLLALPILFTLALESVLGRLFFSARAHKALGYGFLAATLAFTVLRNMPHYPFTLLAPY